MRNQCLVAVISSICLFLFCSVAGASIVNQVFYAKVISLDNSSYWGVDTGDYIEGFVSYNDEFISQDGSYLITYEYAEYSNENQKFDLSLNLKSWTLTAEDDMSLQDGTGSPALQFDNGKLVGLEWVICEKEELKYFNFTNQSLLVQCDSYELKGSFALPTPLPSAFLLFSSGLLGAALVRKKHTA